MNWKEFLKPDWRKLIITIIIGFIGFLSYIIMTRYIHIIQLILFLPIFFIVSIIPEEIFIPLFILNSLWLLSIPYWYLISCFMIWIYNEKKKVGWKEFIKKHKFVSISIILVFSFIFYIFFNSFFYTPCETNPDCARVEACKTFKQNNCINPNLIQVDYDVNGDDVINITYDNLQNIAKNYYGCENLDCIKRLCGCLGY